MCFENVIAEFFYLRKRLQEWGKQHLRSYPWRFSNDPYEVLLAEFFLRRTGPKQVLSIYDEFFKTFPDFETIIKGDKNLLDFLLHKLGLHIRKKQLIEMVEYILLTFEGQIPCRRSLLLRIPGVGSYIASIFRCSICECLDPPLDANTVRIVGRFFNFPINDSSRRNKKFRNALTLLMEPDQPRFYAYCLIDLGSIVCKPHKPNCLNCPLNPACCYAVNILS
ncbi:A/G-specific DNA-adenine glycosylase [Thermovibrio guaymasensis]|uniref:A/G-specific DNA-adenine glycosylase n=1 Tax=Thermovibrio guaymasensis TaxID=240167 RepID=A0A420W582_9BACT|nr:A/G-specific DNA-adenine glycosylase [Thermovibrio guaymasensis]